MAFSLITGMKEKLSGNNLIDPDNRLIGCSEEEIEQLKEKQGVAFLPEIYRQYLLTFGHGTGGYLFRGEDVLYSAVMRLKEAAQETLEYENEPPLPDDMFVFWGHHGYVFYCFPTADHNEDPPIYSFESGGRKLAEAKVNLSDYYRKTIEATVKYYRKSSQT